MGFLGGLGKIVSGITGFVDKALSFVKKPLDFVMKPLTGIVDKLADKLPFGLGNLVKPFVNKFLGSAVGWLAGGPLGGVMSLISKAAPTIQTIDNVLHVADGALNGGFKGLPQTALSNAQNIFSSATANTLFA